MSAPVRPRQLVHHGTVEAAALVIDPALIGEAAARGRVLALWEPDCRVSRLNGTYLLRFASPQVVSTRHAPGLPLVHDGSVTASAPLRTSERGGLEAPAHALVTIRAGEAQVDSSDGERVDPSDWFDVREFHAVAVEPLAAPPPPVSSLLTPVDADARHTLVPGLAVPSAEAAEIMEELRTGAGERNGPGWRGRVESGAYRIGGILGRLFAVPALSAFMRLVDALLPRFSRTSTGESDLVQEHTSGTDPAAKGSGASERETPSALSRLFQRLQRWSAMALLRSQLGRVLAHRHARYLSQLLNMFEQGRLDEALRHAIPLGGQSDEPARPALGLPSPRENLAITSGRQSSASFFWGADIHAELRRRYRLAVEQLTKAGRIEEAAFVLVELLQATEEAVGLLEKHGKLELAAKVAESRNLAPDLVIRQWFLAGNTERALAIARRTGAFASAVWRLQRTHPERALAFRLQWADLLAQSGSYAAAVDVLWGVPDANRLLERFIELAIEQGGISGARMLPRKLVVAPGAFASVRDRALGLLARLDEPAPLLAFAESLKDVLGGRTLKLTPKDHVGIRVWSAAAGGANLPAVASTRDSFIDMDELARDTGIRRADLVRALEKATHQAALKALGRSRHLEATFSETKGVVELSQRLRVVQQRSPNRDEAINQILLDNVYPAITLGEGIQLQIYYRDADREEAEKQDRRFSEVLDLKTAGQGLGRIETEALEQLQQYVLDHRRSVVGEAMRVLARPTIRSLLRLSPRDPLAFALARDLAAVAEDGALRADLPSQPKVTVQPLKTRAPPLIIDVDARDIGHTPVLDAAFLPHGRVLVALGEIGARLLTPDGRTVVHFDRPAHSLVMSDHGDRAIAMAPRGEISLLSVIDLTTRTARPWTEARIDRWASTYDGATWFVSVGTRFQAVDALSPELRAVWSVDTDHESLWISRGEADDRVAVGIEARPPEVWWYETASMALRERRPIEPPGLTRPRLLTAAGDGAVLEADEEEETLHLVAGPAIRDIPTAGPFHFKTIRMSRSWIALLQWRDTLFSVDLMSRDDLEKSSVGVASTRASLLLSGTLLANLRLTRDALTVCDDRGRVVVVSLEDGRVLRSLRV